MGVFLNTALSSATIFARRDVKALVAGSLIFAMLAVLVYGTMASKLFSQPIWLGDALNNLVIFAGCYLVITLVIYLYKPRLFPSVFLITTLMVIAASVGMQGPVAVIYFLISSFLLGDKILGKGTQVGLVHQDSSSSLDILFSLLLGAVIFMTVVSVMVHFKINYSIVYLLLLTIPLLINRAAIPFYSQKAATLFKSISFSRGEFWAFALLCFVIALHVIEVMKPEVSYDGLTTHLNTASRVVYDHYWAFDVKNITTSVMPAGAEWLYTTVFSLGGEFAARLLNFCFLLLTVGLLCSVLKKSCSLSVSLLIAALYVSSPIIQLETGNLFIENIWVAFVAGGTIALMRFWEVKDKKYLLLVAMFLGAALAIKVMSVFIIALIFPFVIKAIFFETNSFDKNKMGLFVWWLGLFFLVSIIPYGYAFIKTGNPVFPFANAFFKSPYYDTSASFANPDWQSFLNLLTPYNITFNTHNYMESQDGGFGFQYLFFIPLLIFSVSKKFLYQCLLCLSLAILYFLVIFKCQAYLRYIYPSLPLFTIMIGFVVARIKDINRGLYRILLGSVVLMTLANIYFMPASGWWHRNFYLNDLTGNESSAYVEGNAPERELVNYVNLKDPGSNIANFSRPYMAMADEQVYTNTWLSNQFSKQLIDATSVKAVYQLIAEYQIKYFIVPIASPKVAGDYTKPMDEFINADTVPEFKYGDVLLRRLIVTATPTIHQ